MTVQAILLAGGRASRMGGIDKPGLLVDGVSMRDRAIAAVAAVGASPVVIVGPEPDSRSDAVLLQHDGAPPVDAALPPTGHGPDESGTVHAASGSQAPANASSASSASAAGASVAAAAGASALDSPAASAPGSVRWVREDPPFSGPAAAVVTALAAIGSDAADWTLLLACDLPRPEAAVQLLADGIRSLESESDGACLADEDGRMQWLTGAYRTTALARAATALPDGGRDQPVRALVAGLSVDVLADHEASARDVDTWEDYEELTKEHP